MEDFTLDGYLRTYLSQNFAGKFSPCKPNYSSMINWKRELSSVEAKIIMNYQLDNNEELQVVRKITADIPHQLNISNLNFVDFENQLKYNGSYFIEWNQREKTITKDLTNLEIDQRNDNNYIIAQIVSGLSDEKLLRGYRMTDLKMRKNIFKIAMKNNINLEKGLKRDLPKQAENKHYPSDSASNIRSVDTDTDKNTPTISGNCEDLIIHIRAKE